MQQETISTLNQTGISQSVWPEMVTSSSDPGTETETDGAAATVTSAMAHSSARTKIHTPTLVVIPSPMLSDVGALVPRPIAHQLARQTAVVPKITPAVVMTTAVMTTAVMTTAVMTTVAMIVATKTVAMIVATTTVVTK